MGESKWKDDSNQLEAASLSFHESIPSNMMMALSTYLDQENNMTETE